MGAASGSAADGEASGSGQTSGSGGGFELNSVTPNAVKNTIGVTAGGIFGGAGSNIFPERRDWSLLFLIAAGATLGAIFLLRRR